ncbi:hypothetical protein JOE40_002224 [Arthrobacter sp. PvP102]|uniref:hypothetical protein n=1 Tax=unclassified Arthrobacter TaxID=235627 RepID=UPI001AE54C7A|nr:MULTISPECIES: hypothetical protein [unclassified Arthrobacter]MBP1232580.1 hypothetical protein [Arthrobacter sp. PvP103]MBP1237715.1 hypothetical protein [Arthrobacter sp. PvP102]
MTDPQPGQPPPVPLRRGFQWLPRTKIGKVAGILDLVMLAFPAWVLPSWFLISFLVGAGGMFESPRVIAANSLFQALVVAGVLVVNLVALLFRKDHAILLGLAAVLLSAVLAYAGWYTAVHSSG